MNLDGKIIEALLKAAEDIGVIGKDSKNQQQHYSFRGIDAIVDRTAPAFRKHGIVAIPKHRYVQSDVIVSGKGTEGRRVIVETTVVFAHKDGSWVEGSAVGEGADYADKASNKAMAQALKYALSQTLLIPTGDADPDAESPETGSGGGGRRQGSNAGEASATGTTTSRQEFPVLALTEEDRLENGYFPHVCPMCKSEVESEEIDTKNGPAPIWKCQNRDCDRWPSRSKRRDGRNWPWAVFGSESDPEAVWGPGGWVDDHLVGGELVREDG